MTEIGSLVVQMRAEVATLKKNLKESEKSISRLNKRVDASSKSMTKMNKTSGGLMKSLNNLKASTLIYAAALYKVIRFGKQAVEAWRVQEQAQARLTQAMINQNTFSEESYENLTKLATGLQRLTVFSDEQILSGMALLTSFRLSASQIQELTPLMLDLATMTARASGGQMDLEGAAKLLGLALEGQTGRLKMAGISLTDMQIEALKLADREEKLAIVTQIVRDNAEGLAFATGVTGTAAFQQFGNAIGDTKEIIGKLLTEAHGPLIRDLATIITAVNLLTSREGEATDATDSWYESVRKLLNPLTQLTAIMEYLFGVDIWDEFMGKIEGFIEKETEMTEVTDDQTEAIDKETESYDELIARLLAGRDAFDEALGSTEGMTASLDANKMAVIDLYTEYGILADSVREAEILMRMKEKGIARTPEEFAALRPERAAEYYGRPPPPPTGYGPTAVHPLLRDFIMRPGQPAVPFSSDDTIVGTKSPEGTGANITIQAINISGVSGDPSTFAAEFSKELRRELRTF